MQIAGIQIYSDIGRGHEYANEMRRLYKNLKEVKKLASIYNNRERLFGVPITNVCSSYSDIL